MYFLNLGLDATDTNSSIDSCEDTSVTRSSESTISKSLDTLPFKRKLIHRFVSMIIFIVLLSCVVKGLPPFFYLFVYFLI